MTAIADAASTGGIHADSTPAVRLRGVRKRFGYRDVLRGVDLDIPAGSCCTLFGANGAGKSTLLRIIATRWTASAGSVEVFGRNVARHAAEVRRELGLVFHQSFLRAELTLEENLRLTCDLFDLNFEGARERIHELLQRFGLFARRLDRVGTFSQGMTKRAGIVRSLLTTPRLWILDEPFSGLDVSGQSLLEEAIQEFTASGERTVLLVTHEEARGERLAKHWVRLDGGNVVERSREGQA